MGRIVPLTVIKERGRAVRWLSWARPRVLRRPPLALGVGLALAGCSVVSVDGLSGATSRPTSSATTHSYDGGALRVTPIIGAVTPVINEAAGARMLASTCLPGSGPMPGELAPVVLDLPPAGRLRTWPPVIVDATTGEGYRYTGAFADDCASNPAPTLTGTDVQLSIPFTVVRAGPPQFLVTFQLPPRGTLDSASNGAHPVATATVPLTRCDEPARTASDAGSGRVVDGPHAPVELLCAGHFDARYGEPADYVRLSS